MKSKQDKYGNGKTGGRPKTKSTILQAERRIQDRVSSEIMLNNISKIFFFSIANS